MSKPNSQNSSILKKMLGLLGLRRAEDEQLAPAKSVSEKPPKRTKRKVKKIGLEYTKQSLGRYAPFEESEYNLAEIAKAEDVESWVRRSIVKHTRSILKEGWTLTGRNPETVAYIERRLHDMALSTNNPVQALVRSIVHDIVRFGNAMLVKQRSETLTDIPTHRAFGVDLKPIVGAFVVDPTTMRVKRDMHGNVKRWQQRLSSTAVSVEFPVYNVVHFFLDRKTGFAFGTPYILPVLDDILMLRRLEEKVDIITHKHAYPLFHYTVGTEKNPAEEYDDGTSEVDDVRGEMEAIPLEGGIVTPERHSIQVLGVEGKAMNLQPLLEYFENRVLGGLHLTTVDIGRGSTANRGTASTMSETFLEQCKEIQAVVAETISFFLLDELLEEGGYSLSNEDRVFLEFAEIDFLSRQVRETHAANLFNNQLLTRTEARAMMRREPLTEDQEKDTHLHLIDLVLAEKQAQAKLNQIHAQASVKAQMQPTNQHGTKPGKTKPKNDALALTIHDELASYREALSKEVSQDIVLNNMAKAVVAILEESGSTNACIHKIGHTVNTVFGSVYDRSIEKWGEHAAWDSCMKIFINLLMVYMPK